MQKIFKKKNSFQNLNIILNHLLQKNTTKKIK